MENQLKLLITRGLPASGKSTYARSWVAEDPNHRVRVEKDTIRKNQNLFEGGVYNHSRGDEAIVIKERDRLIQEALSRGKSVVSSDTNLSPKHISRMSSIARKFNADVEIVDFLDVPLEELINRDKNRAGSVGEQAIRRMFHEQVKTMPTFLRFDPELPFVVVCDLDGTLTTGPKDRSPYDWQKVGQDDINLGIAHILDGIKLIDYAKIFIFSGRDSICRPETEDWLERHDIEYDRLVMRTAKDNRSDVTVKQEFIEQHIRDQYNVLIWFDDRVRVANMLRDTYGINVAQLGDPNYAF